MKQAHHGLDMDHSWPPFWTIANPFTTLLFCTLNSAKIGLFF
jgi:hypothetical protein